MLALVHPRPGRARFRLVLCVLGSACAGIAVALLGLRPALAAGQVRAAGSAVVTVIAGKPSEFAFKPSRSSAIPWQAKSPLNTVTFKVTNRGALSHRFEVCATAVTSAKLNACAGAATKLLEPGQSATLTVTFKRAGTYEYLSSMPGQAAKGMKGMIGVGVALSAVTPTPTKSTPTVTTPAPTTTATTPKTTTTTPSSTTPGPTGDAAAGATVWANNGCSDCHTLADVQAASGGNVSPNLNSTHSGGPFPNGPLSATQIAEITAYVHG